jgi:predicted permease
VLLAAAFLFLHNLKRAMVFDPGFEVNRTAWASMRLAPEGYAGAGEGKRQVLIRTALQQLRALPGVEGASITTRVPLNSNCMVGASMSTDLDRRPANVEYSCNDVAPDYFRTMGIPLLAGREFTETDQAGSPGAAIVNESFARRLFGAANPVGHVVYSSEGAPPRTIVGVVKDGKYFALGEKQRLALYQPFVAKSEGNLEFLVRTAGDPSGTVRAMTDVLNRLDASAAVETKPMSRALGLALLPSRAGAALFGAMGALGVALAAIGLYGVLLYAVSRRTREIGVRVALGAEPGQVLGMVFREGLALAGAGTAAGLAIAILVMRPMAMFLVPGLSPSDPSSFLAAAGVLGAVTMAAILAPALRALRVDPMTALRYE